VSTQLQLFEPSRDLADVGILDRLAAVEVLFRAEPDMPQEQRWQLLGLVISPRVFGSGVES
jgi:hypothetical protein